MSLGMLGDQALQNLKNGVVTGLGGDARAVAHAEAAGPARHILRDVLKSLRQIETHEQLRTAAGQ
jgi:hypothetical protein